MIKKGPFTHEKYFYFKQDRDGLNAWQLARNYIEDLLRLVPGESLAMFPESGNIRHDLLVYECGNFIATCMANNPDVLRRSKSSDHQRHKSSSKQVANDIEEVFRLLKSFQVSDGTTQAVASEISYSPRAKAFFSFNSLKRGTSAYQVGFWESSPIEGGSRTTVEAAADIFLWRLWNLQKEKVLTTTWVAYLWTFFKYQMSPSRKGRNSTEKVDNYTVVVVAGSQACEKRRRDKKKLQQKVTEAQAADYYNFLYELKAAFPAELGGLIESFEVLYCSKREMPNPTEVVKKMMALSDLKKS
ncbi:hypothetical protein [Bdellovibrio sp.]|uniref:hypothetical protein n=1 Tax=Bdellovibrio sp. TaxID=28201 RepID=UPI003221C15D